MLITELYSFFLQHPFISTDTRSITPGSIFFALKGPSFNANEFALQALEMGAAYAVVDEEKWAVNNRCVLVEDSLRALQELALYHRQQLKIPVIGITGTNGKTTTKELIYAVLSQRYPTLATKGNLNNHIGVPLTLLSITTEIEIAVIEMGANHSGEIEFLCRLAQPDYGIITNVGKAHLEGFGSFEGVKKAKKELYDYISATDGTIFIHADNSYLSEMAAHVTNQVSYGISDHYSCCATPASASPFLSISWRGLLINTRLAGAYNFENVLAAICIGCYFGLEDGQIKKALENYIPSNNRSQIIRKDSNEIIMDAYNANPTSMRAALQSFHLHNAKNKLAILGDMFELGEESDAEHAALLQEIGSLNIGTVLLAGKDFYACKSDSYFFFETTEQLTEWLQHHKPEHTTILVKGSRGMKLESVLDVL